MSSHALQLHLSEAEYLAGEEISDIKHEYIDGQVYAMSGASANHNRLAGNVHTAFNVHLKGKSCQPYTSDMKVKIGSRYFYPDVMVDCSDVEGYFTETPVILVEVLSKSTKQIDKTIKLNSYIKIPTLQEYVLIEQDSVEIEILRRKTGWQPEYYFLGDSLSFESIALILTVEEIYDRVKNTDITEWLTKKELEE
ncbi:MAG TPA: Uma2 family endonuclease, partial [Aquirhabdus sp.]